MTTVRSPSHPLLKEVIRLQRLVEEQSAELRELRRVLSVDFSSPSAWGLTRREGQVFAVLVSTDTASKERLRAAVYGGDAEIADTTIQSLVSELRQKTRRFGVRIIPRPRRGYSLVDRQHYLAGAR